MTKQEILDKLGMDEYTYQKALRKFSEANRATLKRYLIGNGRRKTQHKKEAVVNILDTSYIVSPFCKYSEISDAVILPKVNEQLVIAYKNGSKKVCKFLHMILDGEVDVELVKYDATDIICPDYEDDADLEIIDYARKLTEKTPVVYTADKVLALRCKQYGISCNFFDSSKK